MNKKFWNSVITLVTADKPADLDRDIMDFSTDPASKTAGAKTLTCEENREIRSGVLWPLKNPNSAFLGVRVTRPLDDRHLKAILLASLAIEKEVTPIILTTLGESGFEKFGFRVERLAGETRAEVLASEQNLKVFWDLVTVIDIQDLK